jgi:hypothetical protein
MTNVLIFRIGESGSKNSENDRIDSFSKFRKYLLVEFRGIIQESGYFQKSGVSKSIEGIISTDLKKYFVKITSHATGK